MQPRKTTGIMLHKKRLFASSISALRSTQKAVQASGLTARLLAYQLLHLGGQHFAGRHPPPPPPPPLHFSTVVIPLASR